MKVRFNLMYIIFKIRVRRSYLDQKDKSLAEQDDDSKLSQSQAKKCADSRKGREEHMIIVNKSLERPGIGIRVERSGGRSEGGYEQSI